MLDEDGATEIDNFGLDDENPDVETQQEEEKNDQENLQVDDDANQNDENAVTQDEKKTGKDNVEKKEDELDSSKKDESEGMSENSQNKEEDKSFNVSSKKKEEEKSDDLTGTGTQKEQQKTLDEDPDKAERLDLVEGTMTGEEGVEKTDLFQHVMDKRDEDKSAIDRADDEVKDQIFHQDFDMEEKEKEDVEEVRRVKEENMDQQDKSKADKPEFGGEDDEQATSKEQDKEFVETMTMARGTDSITVRQDMGPISTQMHEMNFDPSGINLQQITLNDNEENDAPVLTQLSHSLSEQLRLILNPTKASSLQGDFRTGKRLNMRKIIPFIASDFKKDKIWLRRTKPTKREFQILVALDDSSSMADNKSRQIALESLNTISSAMSLLEAGQIGVLRYGETAEVVHPLNVQWSQTAGHKIQNQFR